MVEIQACSSLNMESHVAVCAFLLPMPEKRGFKAVQTGSLLCKPPAFSVGPGSTQTGTLGPQWSPPERGVPHL